MLMILLVTDDRKGSGGIKKLLTFKSIKACQTIGVGFNFFHTFPAAQLKITIEIFFPILPVYRFCRSRQGRCRFR